MKKILVADVPQMDARYTAALAGWQIGFARTMGEVRQALAAGPHDLVAIGVYFDDSRMFDLVRLLRSEEQHRVVPIACVRGCRGFTAVSTRTLELTVKALAADEFVDLVNFADDEAGNAALRAAAERLLKA